jgi:hypothetical protein
MVETLMLVQGAACVLGFFNTPIVILRLRMPGLSDVGWHSFCIIGEKVTAGEENSRSRCI